MIPLSVLRWRVAVLMAASTSRSGVRSIDVLIDGAVVSNGHTEQPCPQSSCPLSVDFTLTPTELAEGRHTVRVVVKDWVGISSESTPFDIIIDRTAPVLDLTGVLKDKANQELSEGFWTMDAASTDEKAGTQTAGVRSIEVTVNGAHLAVDGEDRGVIDQEGDCAQGGCPLDYDTIAYYTREYAAGEKTIAVRAEDYAGNTTTQEFTVTSTNNRPAAESQAQASSPPFLVYHVGNVLEELEMTEAVREHIATDPDFPDLGRQDSVTYLYGACPPLLGAALDVDGGCLPPIQVQSSPLCEKHASLYQNDEAGAWEYEAKTIKSVPAASFDGGRILEIYTGNTTVTIYGALPAQVLRFAEALTLAVTEQVPTLAQPLYSVVASALPHVPLPVLPPPDMGVLAQTEPCA